MNNNLKFPDLNINFSDPFANLGGQNNNTNPFDMPSIDAKFNNPDLISNKSTAKTYPSYGELKKKLSKNSEYIPTIDVKDLKIYQKRDSLSFYKAGEELISGYLNLTSKDGWKQGHYGETGGAFARFMIVKYFLDKSQDAAYKAPVLEKVIHGFQYVGSCGDLITDSYRPKKSRICYDAKVTGWENHRVSRLVGNLGSVYDPSKPFFEVLVNSQGKSATNTLCQPFFVSIFKNEKELDERREALALLTVKISEGFATIVEAPKKTAYPKFYNISLIKPEDYLKQNKGRLGPNSIHLLNGLEFLQNKTISAQKSGNCWIKQPMRALLVSLFIEYYTDINEITPEAAWDQAKVVYKRLQKAVAIPYITKLVNTVEMTTQMKQSALEGIETQKKL